MTDLRVIKPDELDPTQPGHYIAVVQGKNFAEMAQNFAAYLQQPQFVGMKILHVIHGQELRINPLNPRQAEAHFSIMAVLVRNQES